MDSAEQIKKQLHSLIDASDDAVRLGIVYQILNQEQTNQNPRIALTAQQELELQKSYKESYDDSNLMDLDVLRGKHSRWLEG